MWLKDLAVYCNSYVLNHLHYVCLLISRLTSCHYLTTSIIISSGAWKMNFMELWGSGKQTNVTGLMKPLPLEGLNNFISLTKLGLLVLYWKYHEEFTICNFLFCSKLSYLGTHIKSYVDH